MRERSKTYKTHLGCLVHQRKTLNEEQGRIDLDITLSTPVELELVKDEGKVWEQPPSKPRVLRMEDFLR